MRMQFTILKIVGFWYYLLEFCIIQYQTEKSYKLPWFLGWVKSTHTITRYTASVSLKISYFPMLSSLCRICYQSLHFFQILPDSFYFMTWIFYFKNLQHTSITTYQMICIPKLMTNAQQLDLFKQLNLLIYSYFACNTAIHKTSILIVCIS